jgi:sugar porter (SP) family MFS transporter
MATPAAMNPRILVWSITSALAGFLFGFDTVVISGAEQRIQALWGLSPEMHGVAMASALYGTVLGSLAGGWPTDRFGRKRTLILIGFLYVISAIWSALADNVGGFITARLIGGLGIGISTVVAPLYISEIAPPARRGLLAGMFQFNIVFGIVIAYLSNALLADVGENAWRWMLGVAAFPSLIYSVLSFSLPESPRWLLARHGDVARGKDVLRLIDPSAHPEDIETRAAEMMASADRPEADQRFWTRALRTPIVLAFLVAFFNQLSGINAILYFAPRIFEMTGLGAQAALLQSVGIGLTNLVFTFVGLWLIDKLGRRTLLTIGSFGYIGSLSLVAWAFASGHVAIVPLCIFAFIASHAVGQGAVIWVFIAEIFPNRHRAKGQALGSSTHWVFAALLTTLFPKMVTAFSPASVFLFFCAMMVLQLIWVRTMVIETKGVALEDIQKRLGVA